MRLRPGIVRPLATVAALTLALPLPLGKLSGLYLWTSPLVLFGALLSRQGLTWLHLLGAAALLAALVRRRWYCRWACPAGVLCDTASRLGRRGAATRNTKSRPALVLLAAGVLAALLGVPLLGLVDPVNLVTLFGDAFRRQSAVTLALKGSGLLLVLALSFAWPGFWCGRLCPLGALQDTLSALRRWFDARQRASAAEAAGERLFTGRRLLLGALAGAGLKALFLPSVAAGQAPRPLRPPGALPEERLKATCLRCGNCGRACPSGIIRESRDLADWAGLCTPQVTFESGYCPPDCDACGQVCASGAIRHFTRRDKPKLVLGLAEVRVADCLLVSKRRECDLCRRYCGYAAVLIQPLGEDLKVYPQILADKCVGCGACQVACPTAAISIRPV